MIKEILRLIIGLVFIASGFVKAVDVKGFSFKLEEYFSPTVFNLPFFEKYALPIAAIVVVLELILGVMLVLKIQLKKTLTALISLCIFFAFLTFYSAYFNKVTDCGCFGDAIKFTPWQSFIKDIILLFGLLILWFLYRNTAQNSKLNRLQKTSFGILMIVFGLVIYRGISHEPMIDFRAYIIGTDLKAERAKIAADPDVYKTFYVLKNEKSGEEKKVNQDDYVNDKSYWEDGTPWKILEDKTISEKVKQGYVSEISKLRLEDENGNDITGDLLNQKKVHLLFMYKPKQLSPAELSKAEELVKKWSGDRVPVYGIAPEKNIYKNIPALTMDATPIKTIARSNPFVVTLQNGKITDKQPLSALQK